jgi:hypothetical protein
VKATGFFYLKLPAGYVQEWHPAPRRQYVIAVSGRAEIELADGKKIALEPGRVILAEDITGKGHLSRCLGPQDCIVAEVPFGHLAESPILGDVPGNGRLASSAFAGAIRMERRYRIRDRTIVPDQYRQTRLRLEARFQPVRIVAHSEVALKRRSDRPYSR